MQFFYIVYNMDIRHSLKNKKEMKWSVGTKEKYLLLYNHHKDTMAETYNSIYQTSAYLKYL